MKVPVCPVVSMPAKKSAAISGNMRWSGSGRPVLGLRALSSRSAKLPFCGGCALMCSSSFHTMLCGPHKIAHQPLCADLSSQHLRSGGERLHTQAFWRHKHHNCNTVYWH